VRPLGTLVVAPTHDGAMAKLRAMFGARGLDVDTLLAGEKTADSWLGRFLWAYPDEVGAQVEDLLASGLGGILVNLTGDAGDSGAVGLAGETLAKALT
jgi:hypothetical protein